MPIFILCGIIFINFFQANAQELQNKKSCHLNFSIGPGTSVFKGLSLYSSLAFQKKQNQLSLRWIDNSENGNKTSGEYSQFEYYNDYFRDISLLYGRTYKKNKLFASASAGVGCYTYYHNWLNIAKAGGNVDGKSYSGVGLALETKLLIMVNRGFSLGTCFFWNVNKDKSINGASLNLVFGILNE